MALNDEQRREMIDGIIRDALVAHEAKLRPLLERTLQVLENLEAAPQCAAIGSLIAEFKEAVMDKVRANDLLGVGETIDHFIQKTKQLVGN